MWTNGKIEKERVFCTCPKRERSYIEKDSDIRMLCMEMGERCSSWKTTRLSSIGTIEMPSGLRSQERHSVDDQRHFAVAYKPTRDNAKSFLYSKLDPGERQLASGPLAWA